MSVSRIDVTLRHESTSVTPDVAEKAYDCDVTRLMHSQANRDGIPAKLAFRVAFSSSSTGRYTVVLDGLIRHTHRFTYSYHNTSTNKRRRCKSR